MASVLLLETGWAGPLSLEISVYQAARVSREEVSRYPMEMLGEQSLRCRLATPLLLEQLAEAGSTMGHRSLAAQVTATDLKDGTYRLRLNLELTQLCQLEACLNP